MSYFSNLAGNEWFCDIYQKLFYFLSLRINLLNRKYSLIYDDQYIVANNYLQRLQLLVPEICITKKGIEIIITNSNNVQAFHGLIHYSCSILVSGNPIAYATVSKKKVIHIKQLNKTAIQFDTECKPTWFAFLLFKLLD